MAAHTTEASAHAPAHGHGHDDGKVHVHIAPTLFYVGILGALLVLTFLTVYVSYFDFGSFNTIVAVIIATCKAGLVAAFFMHLRHDKVFNTLSFLTAFLFLALFLLLTQDDLGRRGDLDPTYGGKHDQETGQQAPGGMPVSTAAPGHGAAPEHGGEPEHGAAPSGGGEHH